jgi:hypothetical protein
MTAERFASLLNSASALNDESDASNPAAMTM